MKCPATVCAIGFGASLFFVGSLVAQVAPTAEEMQQARAWIEQHAPDGAAGVPFSFQYDGRDSAECLPGWELQEQTSQPDESRTESTYTWRDSRTGLMVRQKLTHYRDFPTVEWVVELENVGSAPTPLLEDISVLDETWTRQGADEFTLHHQRGSQASQRDYEPLTSVLEAGQTLRLSGRGGRPSDADWPYFNLAFDGGGRIVAIGWPGQWAAQWTRDSQRGLRLRIGQENTHLRLLPGEKIRTPLVVLQFWRGDLLRAQNVWRRWMIRHNLPRPGGRLPPTQFVASSSRAYEEMIHADEDNQIMHIRRYLEEGLRPDYWWMDAGWYIQEHGWPQVGTWEVDPRRFPRGFKPISDFAHAHGVKILVWFEPERVMPGTWLCQQHPEWLLPRRGKDGASTGMRAWRSTSFSTPDPNVSCNLGPNAYRMAAIEWAPGRLSFHPGPDGQFSVIRFTAPKSGEYRVQARFLAIDRETTTSVHVLAGDRSVFAGKLRLDGAEPEARYEGTVALQAGATLDFAVGYGNGSYICDSTGLEAHILDPQGRAYDAARDFDPEKNPSGAWSYGWMQSGAQPDPATFALYDTAVIPQEDGPRLLDLGNPEARRWLTDHIDRLLTEQGIDLYREDFNIEPLAFWRAADDPDRQGITENRYVTGHLAYWDELRRRHPDMLIDSCASGGRRNDLETMRRAVPLWRSDYAYEPIGHQGMTYGLSFWLPYHGTGTVACSAAPYYGAGPTPVEPYAFWSNVAPSLGCGVDIRVRDLDYEALRRLYQAFREVSPCFYGDYYPLTPYSLEKNVWIAWQFDLPEEGRGLIQAFRRDAAPSDSPTFRLRGLDPEATYALTQWDSDRRFTATGRELMERGFSWSLESAPSAAVMMYQRVAGESPRP
ncbi:MAG: hypothetical protein Kow0040_17500 [Thermogutta sp.]